ncbi:hypothetical protein [Saccharomonospora azurea]|uniref:hypothetical protein n=1 Tax=Saccharomonospora azurea TaxID=40988 RepID=UPI002FC3709D
MAEELEEDRKIFSSAQRVSDAPSGDQPSIGFMNSLHEEMSALEDLNNSMRDYVAEFVDKLEAAKKSITESDGGHAESFGGSKSGA